MVVVPLLVCGFAALVQPQTDAGAGGADLAPVLAPAPLEAVTEVSYVTPEVASPTTPIADPNWVATEASRTGIPARAIQSYGDAALNLAKVAPECKLGWNTLAALGWIESGHGTHGGSYVQADGNTSQPIVGPALDGFGYAKIEATGTTSAVSGDGAWDHAVGPMQFIGSTWQRWGVDGNGDGVADPMNLDDAALSAGRYLCAAGGDLADGKGWTRAVHAYNHSDSYVDAVRNRANLYAAA
jgi:membrane-bound lytic murein transglycosylase B